MTLSTDGRCCSENSHPMSTPATLFTKCSLRVHGLHQPTGTRLQQPSLAVHHRRVLTVPAPSSSGQSDESCLFSAGQSQADAVSVGQGHRHVRGFETGPDTGKVQLESRTKL